MKSIFSLIAVLILPITLISQDSNNDSSPISIFVNYKLPKEARKLSKAELVNKSNVSKEIKNNLKNKVKKGEYYDCDEIIIFLNAVNGPTKLNHLQELKKGVDYLYKLGSGITNYKSQIIKIKNNSFLLYSYNENNVGYSRFTSVNESHNIALVGVLEYNLNKEEKAKKLLKEVLESISFKI